MRTRRSSRSINCRGAVLSHALPLSLSLFLIPLHGTTEPAKAAVQVHGRMFFSLPTMLHALNSVWVDGRRRILPRGCTSGSYLGALHVLVADFPFLFRWSWCRHSHPPIPQPHTDDVRSNKWVLNATEAPLFFLWTQLMIAVFLFLLSSLFRLLPDQLSFDLAVCKGLVPLVLLNVASLRYIFSYIIYSSLLTDVV